MIFSPAPLTTLLNIANTLHTETRHTETSGSLTSRAEMPTSNNECPFVCDLGPLNPCTACADYTANISAYCNIIRF